MTCTISGSSLLPPPPTGFLCGQIFRQASLVIRSKFRNIHCLYSAFKDTSRLVLVVTLFVSRLQYAYSRVRLHYSVDCQWAVDKGVVLTQTINSAWQPDRGGMLLKSRLIFCYSEAHSRPASLPGQGQPLLLGGASVLVLPHLQTCKPALSPQLSVLADLVMRLVVLPKSYSKCAVQYSTIQYSTVQFKV